MSTPNKLWSLATDRETDRSGWHRRDAGAYGEEYASAIKETVATNPDRLLAAIPSPFARLHGFDVAFGFLSDPKAEIVGDSTFHANVSQCLDALELLFHWQTHQMGDALTIVRWEPKQELPRLMGSPRPGHAVLGDALSLYLGQDKEVGTDVDTDSLWLVCVERGTQRSVLFVGSPLTIVAPAPHAAKLAAELALRMPGRDQYELYFSTITPLHQRPPAFQAYVRALFRAGRGRLSQRCERMFKYVNRVMAMPAVATAIAPHDKALYAPITTASGAAITVHGLDIRSARRDDFLPERVTRSPRRILADRGPVPVPLVLVDEVTSTGRNNSAFKAPERDARPLDERTLPDEKVRYPYLVASDLFQDQILRVPYLVNTTAFILPAPLKDAATASFLPPIHRLYLEYFKETLLATRLRYRPLEGGVRCELDVPLVDGSVLTLSKAYYQTPRLPGVGTIVDVDATLVAFPMLRPMRPNGDAQVPAFDDLTTVLLAELEPTQTADLPWRTNLAFYAASAAGLQRLDAVSVQERTPKAPPTYTGSRIFTLKHALPAAIELLATDAAGTTVRALICPATRPRLVGRDTFYAAVDFGTTNTFVALGRRLGGEAAPKIEPLTFPDGEDATLALHAPHQVGKLVSPADTLASHELVPRLLGTGRHPLPTRTAVAERRDARTTRMFQDVNIAFFLQRDGIRPHAEIVTTNLKWMRSNDIEAADRVRVFLRELLHLVRTRVLMLGGDPQLTQVIWFWPLSFTTYLRETLERMWKEEARAVLGVPESAIGNMTESAAPFYYHEARGGIASDKPVLSIDIGGGSTDVVFFEDQKPHFGTSFNFAGNALWGDGYNRVRSKADHNGIVEWAEPLVSRALARLSQQDQLDVQQILQPPLAEWAGPSEEAINLCFAVDDVVRLTEQMRSEPLIKLMILLHYSAILFHCAQMMRLRALQRPEILCFSGFGSKALDVLDPTSDKRHLGDQAMRLFDVVYDHWSAIADVAVTDDPDSGDAIVTMVRGLSASRPLQVKMAAKLKEATCEGGILAADRRALHTSPAPFVYLGGADDTILARGKMPSYDELASDASIKPAIAANVRRFIAIFLGFAEQYESFGIPTQIVSAQRSLLWSQVPELLNLGFDRRLRRDVGASQRVTESLFFYPLIDKIVRIGKELKTTSQITV